MRRGGWRTGGRAPLPARIRRDAPTHVRRHLDRWFSHRASTGHSKCRDISSHLKKYRQPWTRRCTPRRRLGRTPTSCGRDPRCRCTRRSPRGYKWGSNTRSSRAPGRRDSFRGRETRPTACSETRRYSWPRPRPFAAGGTSGSRPRPFGRAGHDPPFRRAGREPLRGNKKFTAPSCRIVASTSTPSTRRCSMAWRCRSDTRVDFCTARGTALAAPRGLERLHVGDDAGDGRLLRGVRHPGCPGAGYALPVSRGASAPAESKILVREPDHGLSRRVVWRPPPYLPASAR